MGRSKKRKQGDNGPSMAELQAALRENNNPTITTNNEAPTDNVVTESAPNINNNSHNASSANSASGSLKRARPDDEDGDDEDKATPDDQGDWEVARPSKKKKKTPRHDSNKYPSLTLSPNAKLHAKIKLTDLRDLALYILADGVAPQWVSIGQRPQFRKFVTVFVPGLEEAMFKPGANLASFASSSRTADAAAPTEGGNPDDWYPKPLSRDTLPVALQPFADMFPHIWPVKSPGDDKGQRMFSPIHSFLTAPVPKQQKNAASKEPSGFKNERTRITEFLATQEELMDNTYLLHPAMVSSSDEEEQDGSDKNHDSDASLPKMPEGWVATRVQSLDQGKVPEEEVDQGSVTAGRQVLGLDCEMCMTGDTEFSLTRISIVNWDGEQVLDKLVKPSKPIINYVTQYSGITEEMLAPVTTTLADIQQELLELIGPRTILVGHSLESDLKALQLTHPFIVDTSLLFPHPRGPPFKNALKFLTTKHLSREIQQGHGKGGHNSLEDARACLDLVRVKCEKGKLWGMPDAQTENVFRRLARAGTAYKAQGGEEALGGIEVGKTSAAVDWGDPNKGLGAGATHRLKCKSDDEIVHNVLRAVRGDEDGLEIRAGGVDFVWARMRELEALQGWNKTTTDGSAPDPNLLATQYPAAGDKPPLEQCLEATSARLKQIYDGLPPCTGLVVYSGSGNPREMVRLQTMHMQFKKEFNTPGKMWDELSVRWTDTENQALNAAVKAARAGIGFITVK